MAVSRKSYITPVCHTWRNAAGTSALFWQTAGLRGSWYINQAVSGIVYVSIMCNPGYYLTAEHRGPFCRYMRCARLRQAASGPGNACRNFRIIRPHTDAFPRCPENIQLSATDLLHEMKDNHVLSAFVRSSTSVLKFIPASALWSCRLQKCFFKHALKLQIAEMIFQTRSSK